MTMTSATAIPAKEKKGNMSEPETTSAKKTEKAPRIIQKKILSLLDG
jgi:hypothetical protein